MDTIPLFHADAMQAEGFTDTRVFDVGHLEENEALRVRERRDNNASLSVFDFVMNRLTAIDSRFAQAGRFTGTLRDENKMRQRIQFGSDAMSQMATCVSTIRDRLNDEFRLVSKGRHGGTYTIKPFNLVSPDITGVAESIREKYRVRHYDNAIHAEYNGLNPFEVQVAAALDLLGLVWCRNPSKTGYGIPITELGSDVEKFFPDFLLWTDKEIWAIDPKGAHLKEAAVQNKLFDVMGVEGVTTPVRVALILDGTYSLNQQGTWTNEKKAGGFTLVRRATTGVKAQTFSTLSDLVAAIVQN